MLKKSICRRCEYRGKYPDKFETQWRRGRLFCYKNTEGKGHWEATFIYSNPPECCPYFLEHLVNEKEAVTC
jgi:hypothetical protein